MYCCHAFRQALLRAQANIYLCFAGTMLLLTNSSTIWLNYDPVENDIYYPKYSVPDLVMFVGGCFAF